MSNTRHAPPGSPLRQNRFASSAEIERGLLGNLVAIRTETLKARADRELVFWLQGISWTVGLEHFTADFLAAFRARLGSRSMRQLGVKPGANYDSVQTRQIRDEFPPPQRDPFRLKGEMHSVIREEDRYDWPGYREWIDKAQDRRANEAFRLFDIDVNAPNASPLDIEAAAAWDRREKVANAQPSRIPTDTFLKVCAEAAQSELVTHLQRLCLSPGAAFEGPWYFHELIPCLREYQTAWAEQQTAAFRYGFAPTALSRAVWREVEDVHQMGGTVLLHNSAGNGKSYAAESVCAAHPGRARYVKVPATNDETTFLRAIAEALGVASGLSFKAIQIRERILPVLRTGDIVLVLDSAQWLFPVSDYRYALPNRINWVLSELSEQGVPVVMIADTKLFDTLGLVEARTGWNRAKFVNQLSRMVELPAALAKEDVQAVAAALLPDGDRAAQRKLADYMIVAQGYLHAGKPAAQRARQIAATQKRDRVSLADMTEAIEAWMVPALKDMDAAMKRADAAASGSRSKVRNWRPDTDAQVVAKQGRRRNQIVTSSDLRQPAPYEITALATAGLRRSGAPIQAALSAPETTEFSRSRGSRATVPALSATRETAALVPA